MPGHPVGLRAPGQPGNGEVLVDQDRRSRPRTRWGSVVAVVTLLATAFVSAGVVAAPAGAATAGPKPGGEVRFGLEGETTGGYCLWSSQLAISGIQVVSAVYDTLTSPNTKGKYVPNLAESVTPNADSTEWTIKVRPNIKFQNGEPLNADAVKLNIDQWLKGTLFAFVFNNIDHTDKVDDLTVKVTTKTPWPAFPAYLFLVGRAGIMAPAQINDTTNCTSNLIGTGPFKLDSWKVNESLTVSKNPNYWKKDAKGNQLPYLDKITFVPVVDAPTRDNQLIGGQLDMLHTSSAQSIDKFRKTSGYDTVTEPPGNRDVHYYMLNTAQAPFNNADARRAIAEALNIKQINQIRNKGLFQVTNSVIDSKAQGYVKNNGLPKYNPTDAKALVEKVKAANGGKFDVTFLTTDDTESLAEVQLLAEQVQKVGMSPNLSQVNQAQLINTALAGKFSVMVWRNFHSDPEFGDAANYVWWSKTSPINFPRIDDPAMQTALVDGRSAADADADYVTMNKEMGAGQYIIPGWFVDWTIVSKGVKGILGAPLPDGSQPRFMYGRIPVDALYKTK